MLIKKIDDSQELCSISPGWGNLATFHISLHFLGFGVGRGKTSRSQTHAAMAYYTNLTPAQPKTVKDGGVKIKTRRAWRKGGGKTLFHLKPSPFLDPDSNNSTKFANTRWHSSGKRRIALERIHSIQSFFLGGGESKQLKLDQYFIILMPISYLTSFLLWLQTKQHKFFLIEDIEVKSSITLYITDKNVLLN